MNRRLALRRLVIAVVAAGALAFPATLAAAEQPELHAAGDDAPQSRSGSLRARVRGAGRELSALEQSMDPMLSAARRYADWETCITWVPVTEYGDGNAAFGFSYDNGDGTPTGYQTALAVDRKSRDGAEQYMFLDFTDARGCQSAEPQEGGTADAAKLSASRAATPSSGSLRRLEARVRRLRRDARTVLEASERFDAWESCVSWVPVTEQGDADGRFGYRYGDRGSGAFGYKPAITIDRTPWDDPDYMFLALVGGDRPGGRCQDEPGEAVDRTMAKPAPLRSARRAAGTSVRNRVHAIERDLDSLTEDVDDLREPIGEFDLFDQCMYLIGTTEHGARDGSFGYVYGSQRRRALALDMRGARRAQYRFMAFPAEEPPSIECNEDAGQDTAGG